MTYPRDFTEQQALWNAFQEELVDEIDKATPFILTQQAHPVQADWETAWVTAGNTLPITPGKRLIWRDGDQYRGDFEVLTNDRYYTIVPLNNPMMYRDLCWRNNGDIICLYGGQPKPSSTDTVSPSVRFAEAFFSGLAHIAPDGSILTELWEPPAERLVYESSGVPELVTDMHYRSDLDTAFLGQIVSSMEYHRPTAAGGFAETNVGGYGPAIAPGAAFAWSGWIGSKAASSVIVTIQLRSTSGAVHASQAFVIAAGQAMTRCTISGIGAIGATGQTIMRVTFSTSLPAGQQIILTGFWLNPDTTASGKYSPYYKIGGIWTHSNNSVESTLRGVNVLAYTISTGAIAQYLIPIGSSGLSSIVLVGVYGSHAYVFQGNNIYRFNLLTQTVATISLSVGVQAVLQDSVTGKLVMLYNTSIEVMNSDGTGLTNITNARKAGFVYNGKLYLYKQTVSWPSSLQMAIRVVDLTTLTDEEYVSPYPNFDAFRREFLGHAPLYYTTWERKTGAFIPDVAANPLADPLPIQVSKHPTEEKFLIVFGSSLFRRLSQNIAVLTAETGSTGAVRQVTDEIVPGPDFWAVFDQTLDIDTDSVTVDLSPYNFYNHEILVISVANNCISANDSLLVQFNGSETGYAGLYMRTSAAVLNRVENLVLTAITLPAPNSAIPGMYTLILPDFQSEDYKTALVLGGQHLAVTTTNVQQILGNFVWQNTSPITSVKITTATPATRKLRAGGRIQIAVMKTRGRYNNDVVFNPAIS